ncbi:uncharacterized protein LOC119729208 [Patiria miniata]|uniref:Glutamate-rich protein 1 n=1 Tax=Patiria miniata TaxID=46514 RepID=A0A914A1J6_PATMI|nr:uncharacterized protein LOC119729208 [Patiria miniata]
MNVKKSTRKRESVFKAHVLERLYPPENTSKDETAPQTPTNSLTTKCTKSTQSRVAGTKLYTVQPPSDGLPEAQTQLSHASRESPEEKLPSSCSEAESSDVFEDEERPARKRKRKKKHRKGTAESSAETSLTTSKGDAQSQTFQKESSSQPTNTSLLTKNQRRKLRKKRAKLGRLQNKPTVKATEFTCDVDAQGPGRGDDDGDEGSGDEATREVIEFVEAVWRVYSCDTSKAQSMHSHSQQFQTMIDKLSNDEVSKEAVIRLRDIKRLLVLQDFPRARTKLSECGDNQSSTSESENILLFSTLAEYWMTDIAASDSTSGIFAELMSI